MHQSILTFFLISLACQGCASNAHLSDESAGNIDNITIVTNSTFVNDVSGFTDSIDVPSNKALAEKVNASLSNLLKTKGYSVADKYISVGRAYDDDDFYVINNALERELNPWKLQQKKGIFYSGRLTDAQLTSLHTLAKGGSDIPAVSEYKFKSDALLVIFIEGRTVGFEKVIGEFVANLGITIIASALLGTNVSAMGAEGDVFHIHMGLYGLKDGALLWSSDIDRNTAERSAMSVSQKIQASFPEKQEL